MLITFITANRAELLARTRAKVAQRLAPRPTEQEMDGVPLFLDQLVGTLRQKRAASSLPSGATERGTAVHAAELLELGYTVARVVHDYGDLCQAITELAAETGAAILADDLTSLQLSLDDAIAEAVTEYIRLRDRRAVEGETERLGVLAHELRNQLAAAQLGFHAMRSGHAPSSGSVAALVGRSLLNMGELVNRALLQVRLESGNTHPRRVVVHQLLEDAEIDGSMQAAARGVSLSVAPTPGAIDVEADPQILAGVVANVVQNAIKFTREGGRVLVRTAVVGARVQIDVEDECGGLPPGKAEELFGAFQQRGADRTGLGLGLFISRKGAEANGGAIRVRDIPGHGCVFTIDLPLMLAS